MRQYAPQAAEEYVGRIGQFDKQLSILIEVSIELVIRPAAVDGLPSRGGRIGQ
jgi:hypothetical protein